MEWYTVRLDCGGVERVVQVRAADFAAACAYAMRSTHDAVRVLADGEPPMATGGVVPPGQYLVGEQ